MCQTLRWLLVTAATIQHLTVAGALSAIRRDSVAFVQGIQTNFVKSTARYVLPRGNIEKCVKRTKISHFPISFAIGNGSGTLESLEAKGYIPLKRTLAKVWEENFETIILGGVYGIRFLKFLIYLRYLIEWLPQANPYLPPFDTIYQTTNAYLKLFQLIIPPIFGVDISGIIALFVLENIEGILAHHPNVAQQAL